MNGTNQQVSALEMGEIHPVRPVLLVLASFSRHPKALQWSTQKASVNWGPLFLESNPFEFNETDYYKPTMGPDLRKQFLAFEGLIDPGELAAIKRLTNEWEAEYAANSRHQEIRPLNLDPGYITPAKLILASTKDFAHRIYLSQGVYAELTLQFKHERWQPLPWTFPDYRRADYHEFFSQCRRYLIRRLQEQRSHTP